MRKIYLTFFMLITVVVYNAQINNVVTAPSASLSNGTSGLRAPNGNASHTSMRACYYVPASELSTLNATVSSFGFVLTNTLVNAPANGTLTVYLMNTTANSYTLGTAWSTATVGMTQVYTGVYNIPSGSTATVVDFQFPSNFTYNTGNGLYLAYEYVGGQFATNAAVYSAFTNSAITAGATNNSLTLPAAETMSTTTFRPLFRFGNPNPLNNEVAIQILNAPGKVSETTGTSHVISANIFNGSNTTLTAIPVNLNISGTNPFTSTVVIPTLAPGVTTLVTFPSYSPVTQGISNIVVSIPSDQNNTNNTRNITQSVTCNIIASGPSSLSPVSYSSGVGFNSGSGKIYSVFRTTNTHTLSGAFIAISSGASNVGNSVYAVVADNAGIVIATSNTLNITTAELDTYQTFTFSPLTFMGNTNYHIGLAQTVGSSGYFPLGATPAPSTPTLYFTQSLTNNVLNPLTSNLGFFGIEPVFSSPLCGMVGINEVDNLKSISVSVYPNPSSDKILVEISNLTSTMHIQIMNMMGQVVIEKSDLNAINELNISKLSKGVYFVTVADGKTKTTSKLVIE